MKVIRILVLSILWGVNGYAQSVYNGPCQQGRTEVKGNGRVYGCINDKWYAWGGNNYPISEEDEATDRNTNRIRVAMVKGNLWSIGEYVSSNTRLDTDKYLRGYVDDVVVEQGTGDQKIWFNEKEGLFVTNGLGNLDSRFIVASPYYKVVQLTEAANCDFKKGNYTIYEATFVDVKKRLWKDYRCPMSMGNRYDVPALKRNFELSPIEHGGKWSGFPLYEKNNGLWRVDYDPYTDVSFPGNVGKIRD